MTFINSRTCIYFYYPCSANCFVKICNKHQNFTTSLIFGKSLANFHHIYLSDFSLNSLRSTKIWADLALELELIIKRLPYTTLQLPTNFKSKISVFKRYRNAFLKGTVLRKRCGFLFLMWIFQATKQWYWTKRIRDMFFSSSKFRLNSYKSLLPPSWVRYLKKKVREGKGSYPPPLLLHVLLISSQAWHYDSFF